MTKAWRKRRRCAGGRCSWYCDPRVVCICSAKLEPVIRGSCAATAVAGAEAHGAEPRAAVRARQHSTSEGACPA